MYRKHTTCETQPAAYPPSVTSSAIEKPTQAQLTTPSLFSFPVFFQLLNHAERETFQL